jgi:hypothetical protein
MAGLGPGTPPPRIKQGDQYAIGSARRQVVAAALSGPAAAWAAPAFSRRAENRVVSQFEFFFCQGFKMGSRISQSSADLTRFSRAAISLVAAASSLSFSQHKFLVQRSSVQRSPLSAASGRALELRAVIRAHTISRSIVCGTDR